MSVAVCLMAAVAVLMNAVPSVYEGISEHELPFAVRLALDKVHQPAARGGGGGKELSWHEDAIILLKHVRDGMPHSRAPPHTASLQRLSCYLRHALLPVALGRSITQSRNTAPQDHALPK